MTGRLQSRLPHNCVPHNAIVTELRLRITNGNTALARWIGERSSRLAKCKVLAPLLVARAMDNQFGTGNSQRRVA